MADEANINELVRVRVGTGAATREFNMGRVLAESSEGVTILDEPIRDELGNLRGETGKDGRPAKEKTSPATEAAKKTAASAGNEKE